MQKVREKKQPTFIDIFAGCGGLSLGLMQAGWKGLFAIEHDKNAFETLRHNLLQRQRTIKFSWPNWLPKAPHDVTEVLANHRERLLALSRKVDMIVGGPPCQGFSSAGRRDPSDPRNRLVNAYIEFVRLVQPKVVLIENVRGITQDFEDESDPTGKINYARWIVSALSSEYVVSTRMLDTSSFGVPQKRHRFFIIAIRKDWSKKNVGNPFDSVDRIRSHFLREKGIGNVPVSAKSALSDLEIHRNGKIDSRDTVGFEDISYKSPLTAYQKLMNCQAKEGVTDTRLARHGPDIVARFRKLIEICHADGRLNVSISPELRASFGLRKCAIRVLDPESPSPTITSMPDDLIHYSEPRTLTVRENARLQSFPDWFAFKGKYTSGGERRRREVPRYTQVANAVPPLVAEAIGLALKAHCFGVD
ncbi:DNA cytosine methyltransferase [Burkholderia sp. AU39826]|uniref:DNA cytosine methyltransferase n=1 Tax=Burkholderia sp. AU39826 TaxID=2879634 RepID=UPI001CF408BE|nr:DNA cytosine methyltransferase [Burkholderia sp. AU39826]MCA7969686.1 DNA cytosine methyltransferase [Burkholderia sp. AU39826]